jgi:hypothetical protein
MLHVEPFILPQYVVPTVVRRAKASAVVGRGSLQVMIGKWRITMNSRTLRRSMRTRHEMR